MSVRAISRPALELGREIVLGNGPGDISLKHPSISSALVLSAGQQNPGTKFALWARPPFNDNREIFTMPNLESRQGRIAKALAKRTHK